jgi:hypothetical protein
MSKKQKKSLLLVLASAAKFMQDAVNKLRQRGARKGVLIAISGVALIGIVGFEGTSRSSSKMIVKPSPTDQTATIANPTSKRGELVSIRANGFEPKEITRRPGPFLLVLDNHKHLTMTILLSKAEVDLTLRRVLMPREQRVWSEIIDLPTGTYTLREAAHPGWLCNINIR